MMRLNRKGVKFEWDDLCEQTFQELKGRPTSAHILIILERDRCTLYTKMLRKMDWDVF